MYRIYLNLFIFAVILQSIQSILFPQYTILQISLAVSSPIEFPVKKLFMNNGLQFNYGLPYAVSNFYDPQYWQNLFGGRSLRHQNNNLINQNQTKVRRYASEDDENPDELERKKWDLTAGELYSVFEENLKSFGYEETCLLKSVCQLAQHPFDYDGDEHLIAEVIQFVFSPSQHQAFATHEQYEKERYEIAEQIGQSGQDCNEVYTECEVSLLDSITMLKYANE